VPLGPEKLNVGTGNTGAAGVDSAPEKLKVEGVGVGAAKENVLGLLSAAPVLPVEKLNFGVASLDVVAAGATVEVATAGIANAKPVEGAGVPVVVEKLNSAGALIAVVADGTGADAAAFSGTGKEKLNIGAALGVDAAAVVDAAARVDVMAVVDTVAVVDGVKELAGIEKVKGAGGLLTGLSSCAPLTGVGTAAAVLLTAGNANDAGAGAGAGAVFPAGAIIAATVSVVFDDDKLNANGVVGGITPPVDAGVNPAAAAAAFSTGDAAGAVTPDDGFGDSAAEPNDNMDAVGVSLVKRGTALGPVTPVAIEPVRGAGDIN
jgi:hypothetical protein